MKKRRPFLNRLTSLCLGFVADEDMRESILEDMEFRFVERRDEQNSFLLGIIWLGKLTLILSAFTLKSLFWRTTVIKNYLKITLRNIRKNKGYSFLNISGLAVGIACTILILFWVRDELSYDRFHKNADRIYRVVLSSSDDGIPTNANGSFAVGPALKKDFPEIRKMVRIRKFGQNDKRYVGHKDRKFYESRFFFAEPALFTVFDFPLVKGDPETALSEPNTIILTEEMAHKYFGTDNPLGRVIEADPYNDGEVMLFQVSGIAKSVPPNSHLHFDFLASYSSQKNIPADFSGIYQNFTYILLDGPAAATALQNKLLAFIHRNWTDDPWYTLHLQRLTDIHLHSRLRSEIEANGNILYVYLFTAIAVFVLLIACINFMNLSTARAVKRAKEVGVRKVIGARKNQLVSQFLGESLLLSLLSGLTAVLLIIAVLPLFNRFTGKAMTTAGLIDPTTVLGTAGIVLAVGFISGAYPAFFLSSFQPSGSLKTRSLNLALGGILRKGLVIFQFSLSIGIICASLIAHKQMSYIQSRSLGYDKEQIMVIHLNKDLRQNYAAVRGELLRYPGIENTTTSSLVPTRGSTHIGFRFEGREDTLSQVIYQIDQEFFDTYGLKLLAGRKTQRPISRESAWDFLVSELTTQEAGYASPQEAVGKRVDQGEDTGQIVGVVQDITIYSLHRHPYSISYLVNSIQNHDYLSLRVLPSNIAGTIAHLQKVWQELIPNYPLDYFFLDASFEQMHLSDKKMSEFFTIFSTLAIFIACLGLFGLAAYTAEQKTKEIGVRKILGASAPSIYLLLSREFFKWVAMANLIAWPIAYYAMHKWLQNFVFRTTIGWRELVTSGAAALIIALLTVSFQSLKATTADPVDSLRYE
jgi:putative ABC transport system permease protein